MEKKFSKQHRERLSEAAKLRWQRKGDDAPRRGLQRSRRLNQLKAPKARRDNGQRPLPTDNFYLERDGQPRNHLPALPLIPARPYTTLWRLALAVQEAGLAGITPKALAQEVYGYCTQKERDRCRKAVTFLVNKRRYPIVFDHREGRYLWKDNLLVVEQEEARRASDQ